MPSMTIVEEGVGVPIAVVKGGTPHKGDNVWVGKNLYRVVGRDRGGWGFLTFLSTMCTVGLIAPAYVGVTVEGDVARLVPGGAPAAVPAGSDGDIPSAPPS